MQQGVPPARRPGGRTNPHPAAVRYARSGRLPKRCTIIGSFQRFSNWSARLDSNQQDSVSGAASRTVCDCIFHFCHGRKNWRNRSRPTSPPRNGTAAKNPAQGRVPQEGEDEKERLSAGQGGQPLPRLTITDRS